MDDNMGDGSAVGLRVDNELVVVMAAVSSMGFL